jgi:hypothetical protein
MLEIVIAIVIAWVVIKAIKFVWEIFTDNM